MVCGVCECVLIGMLFACVWLYDMNEQVEVWTVRWATSVPPTGRARRCQWIILTR